MSLQRIKEILEKMGRDTSREQREFMTNEAIKLSQQDMQRFTSLDVPDRQAILGSLGRFDKSAQDAQKSYSNFFNNGDESTPKVDIDSEGITGDDEFNKQFTGVENETEVGEFFMALSEAVKSLRVSGLMFNDVNVKGSKVTLHLQHLGNDTYETPRSEFTFKVVRGRDGMCRVKSVSLRGWLHGKNVNQVNRMLSSLNANTKATSVLQTGISSSYIALFK